MAIRRPRGTVRLLTATDRSAVSIFAIKYADDLQMIAFVAEKHAMILSAQARQRRFNVPELLYVSSPGVSITSQGSEDLQRGWCSTPRISALAWAVQTTPLAIAAGRFS